MIRLLDGLLTALVVAAGGLILLVVALLLRPLMRRRGPRRIVYLGTGQIAQVFRRNGVNLFLERECSDFDGYFEHMWNVHFPAGARGRLDLSPRHHLIDVDFCLPSATAARWRGLAIAWREMRFLVWLLPFVVRCRASILTATNPYLQGLNAAVASRLLGLPYAVIITRDYDWDWSVLGKQAFRSVYPTRRLERSVGRWVLRNADLVLADRQYYRNFAVRNGARPERAIATRVLADTAFATAHAAEARRLVGAGPVRASTATPAEAPAEIAGLSQLGGGAPRAAELNPSPLQSAPESSANASPTAHAAATYAGEVPATAREAAPTASAASHRQSAVADAGQKASVASSRGSNDPPVPQPRLADVRQRYALAPGPLLTYVGRLDPDKMPLELVECLALVQRGYPDVLLACAGEGTLAPEMQRRAADLGIAANLRLLGSLGLEELAALLASSDAVVAPHMGYTLIEAGLTGTPVVTYDYDFHAEIIADGQTGHLVALHDVAALAERVCRVLADPLAAREMGARLREQLLREHSLEAVVPLYRRAYDLVLGGVAT